MAIQAINSQKSRNQRAHRVTVWAGSESDPGVRAEWVVYASNVPGAVARAVRFFRAGPAKKRRFTDWTVNVGPLVAGEVIESCTR